MASETVNKIIEAEKQCDERVEKAKAEAAKIISDKSEQASSENQTKKENAKAEAAQIIAKAQSEAQKILSESSGSFDSSDKVDDALLKAAIEAVKKKALE